MTSRLLTRSAGALLAALALIGMAEPSLAAGPVPNKGDTAFVFTSTVLVLLMTIPGLALFYGGMVRTKNMLSVLMQVFAIVCLVSIIWVTYGYSMAFTNGGALNDFVGGFSKILTPSWRVGYLAAIVAASLTSGLRSMPMGQTTTVNGAMASGQMMPRSSWFCSMAAAGSRVMPMP